MQKGPFDRSLLIEWISVLTAAAAVIGIVISHIAERGRIEFVYGERHMLEHLAGIIGRGRYTFFFGNGIFRTVNEILRRAFNTNDGEESERNGQKFVWHIGAESASEATADRIGQILDRDMRMTMAIAGIHDLRIQNDGIRDLKNGGRKIGFRKFRTAAGAEILNGLAFEDIDVSFASVKNHLLFHDGNALDLLGSAKTSTNLCDDLDVHGDADLIKASVKGDAVHIDVGADHLCVFCTHAAAAFDQFVSDV